MLLHFSLGMVAIAIVWGAVAHAAGVEDAFLGMGIIAGVTTAIGFVCFAVWLLCGAVEKYFPRVSLVCARSAVLLGKLAGSTFLWFAMMAVSVPQSLTPGHVAAVLCVFAFLAIGIIVRSYQKVFGGDGDPYDLDD